jgi:hypothetical protein
MIVEVMMRERWTGPRHAFSTFWSTTRTRLGETSWSSAGSSQVPRSTDGTFDPQAGDWVTVGDDEEAPLRARVTRREGNRAWVQVKLSSVADAVA